MSASDPHSPNSNDPPQPTFPHSAAAPQPSTANREHLDVYYSYDRLEPFPLPDSFFDDAIAANRPSPSPPASFLDNILNPVSRHREQQAHLSFDYHRASPPPRRPQSPLLPYVDGDRPSMPPIRSRPSRLPNGYVDLTHEPDPTPGPIPAVRRKRESVTPGPSVKRSKQKHGSSASAPSKREPPSPETKIEEIDLSDDKVSVQDVLQKQRVDAVKAQQKPEEKPTTFNSFTCVICMDTPTDITATSCGHLFCHTCLMEALIAGENRSGPNEPKRSQCPVCRKFINRTKAADIIPLLMKKGLVTQPRKSSLATSRIT